MAKLHDFYKESVVPQLAKEFGYKSVMQVPRIEKITLNMGLGEALTDKKVLENATNDMQLIAEIDFDKVDKVRGMDIVITTSANTNDEGKALLSAFNFPFRK